MRVASCRTWYRQYFQEVCMCVECGGVLLFVAGPCCPLRATSTVVVVAAVTRLLVVSEVIRSLCMCVASAQDIHESLELQSHSLLSVDACLCISVRNSDSAAAAAVDISPSHETLSALPGTCWTRCRVMVMRCAGVRAGHLRHAQICERVKPESRVATCRFS